MFSKLYCIVDQISNRDLFSYLFWVFFRVGALPSNLDEEASRGVTSDDVSMSIACGQRGFS